MIWRDFLYTFIPIFVAMDVSGLIPVYLSLTKGLSTEELRRVNLHAFITAILISVLFIAVGHWIFDLLGITVPDFEIAGGLLLLVLAIVELVGGGMKERLPNAQVGAVPLGTPLMVGPAVLTSLIILIPLRGYELTLLSLVLNLLIVAIAFRLSRRLVQWIGENGLRATSQVISLFLAAIAVSMIRRGVQGLH